MRTRTVLLSWCRWALLLAGAMWLGGAVSAEETARDAVVVPVTVTQAQRRDLEQWSPSVGGIEAIEAPRVAAEVGGRILEVAADVGRRVQPGEVLARIDPGDYRLARALAKADIDRLQALIRVQELQVKRLRSLLRQKSVDRSSLDEAEARLGALRAQLLGGRVRLQQAERNLARTRVTSPIEGKVVERRISVGDFVKKGTPLFRLLSEKRLRVRLPYPESLAAKLRIGLPVRLEAPALPGRQVTARITDLRPEIRPGNRAIEVIVDLDNPGGWEPGGSVTGAVRIARHEAAVVVPAVSLVRRPAGTVVYVLEGDRVHQRVVETGLRVGDWIEIRRGLSPGAPVIVDGAGFLTEGARVEVKGP